VNKFHPIFLLALATACLAPTAPAQQSAYEQFRAHNAAMTAVQPTWMSPLIQSDARLGQGMRLSVSNLSFPGAHPILYGNNHGISVVANRRYQFDLAPPTFFRNHSSVYKDGFGNAGAQVKYRIVSGNAEHGNFALTAILYHGFGPRAYQNGFFSPIYVPSLAAGRGFGRFAVIGTLGGVLPTKNIYEQGRGIEWNMTAQVHASPNLWFDVENNALYLFAGPVDGKSQNFITPAAFYRVPRKNWAPMHTTLIVDGGMQIATSRFHYYNHNLITEIRVLF